ncbi:MAG: DUF1810 domain-containing protein [Paludibacteraceae bacterium]|nr:DUF1810 domain-containing protein [Paludibacteraceae bacterium]
MEDDYNLQRFLDAQARDYECSLREIRNGLKQSHWVWYIFPQLKGFGHSYNSEYYGIDGIEEARAYYNHPVLGSRLIEITTALLEHKDKPAVAILSPIDARKVKSSMTLFWLASENPLFKSVLDAFYGGEIDRRTMEKCGMASIISSKMDMGNHKSHKIIEINTEIMVEINNLCHFNEPLKASKLIKKYMIPDCIFDCILKGEMLGTIYLRQIYLRNSPVRGSAEIYEELPWDMFLACWNDSGEFHCVCYLSVEEKASFSEAFHIDFDGVNDNDCDPDELGWYYFVNKDQNISSIVNYSGTEYTPVFKMEGDSICCLRPPLIRHHYRLPVFKDLDINTGYDALRLLLESKGEIRKSKSTIVYEKYMDLYNSGNLNAKHAIKRGKFK